MLLAGTSRKLHVTLLAFESQMVEIYEVGVSWKLKVLKD